MKYTYINSPNGFIIRKWDKDLAIIQDEDLAIEMINLFNDNDDLIEFN